MLLHQFNRLSKSKKYQYLLFNGACVSDRNTEAEDILLFQLKDYYVEIFFKRHTDRISKVKCFMDTSELDPYLEEININALFC
jgi:hypothetical protein